MRGSVFSLSHLSPILLVGFLVLSTHLLCAQRKSPLEEIPVHVIDTPAQLATVSEVQTHLHFTQTESLMRFFPHRASDNLISANTKAVQDQATRTAELWGKEKYFVGSIPSKTHHETIYRVDELEYYAHHIPWAGSLIGRICQQAKVHPHVTRLLKVLRPQFGLDNSLLVGNSEVRASPGGQLPQVVINRHL
jgi:hypothetical protein